MANKKNNVLLLSEQHKQVLDLLPSIITLVDINKIYVWMNKAGLEFFGKTAIGEATSYFFINDHEAIFDYENKKTGEIYCVENWQRRRDGKKRFLAWQNRSLSNEKGKMGSILSVAYDITESFETLEKLHYSETQLYNAHVLAHLGPWEFDILKNMFTFNDAFYSLFKTTAKEVGSYQMTPQAYAKRFVYPEDAPMVAEVIKETLATDDPNYTKQVEHRIVYANGEIGYINVRFFVILNKEGKVIKTYGINQDITDFKEKEESLKKVKDKFESKVKELKVINQLMVDRELKMVEMKDRIKQLEGKLQKTK